MLLELSERQRANEILELKQCSKQDLIASVRNIRVVIVADAFTEYLLGKSLLDLKGDELNLDEEKFNSWNRTDVKFTEVVNIVDKVKAKGVQTT
jgi:hypothetical protein